MFVGNRNNIGAGELTRHLREWLFASGVFMVSVDELQSMTRSGNATTLIANLLAELNELGPYVVYCFNYSLGHKLLARPQEDKDRLLAHCLHLAPPVRDDPYWYEAIQEYLHVAPDHFDLNAERDAAELHRMTGGLYRLLGKLLLDACRNAWPSSVVRRVSMADVRRAFQSGDFTSQRADVEVLQSINVSAGKRKRQRGLVCPFPDLALVPSGDVESQQHPASRRPTAAATHAVESALTVAERNALDAMRGAAGQSAAAGRPAATVTKLHRRVAVSAESLMAGAELLSGARVPVANENANVACPAKDSE